MLYVYISKKRDHPVPDSYMTETLNLQDQRGRVIHRCSSAEHPRTVVRGINWYKSSSTRVMMWNDYIGYIDAA